MPVLADQQGLAYICSVQILDAVEKMYQVWRMVRESQVTPYCLLDLMLIFGFEENNFL